MDETLKSDFPVDWVDDNYVSRREFFKFLTLASGGLAVGSIGMAISTEFSKRQIVFETAVIPNAENLAVGSSLEFSYPRAKDICVLIRKGDGKLVAFSRRCTHLSCPVEYQPDEGRLYCPCHNGAFSLIDGHVIQGPPPRPLPQIVLEIKQGKVFAVGIANGEGQES